MWKAALGRIALIVVSVVGATAAISVSLGAIAHRDLARSIAVGYYVVGACALIGSLAFGLRGPVRRDRDPGDDDRPSAQSLFFGGAFLGARRTVRRTTPEERSESRRNSVLFFVFGVLLVALGAGIDPTRTLA
jgi:hypothetical protein